MFLNVYVAHAGVASRRKAVDLIKMGQVSVNRRTVTNPAYQVQEQDIVKVGNRVIALERPVYLVLNKPSGYLSTTADEQGRQSVMDLIPKSLAKRLYPVGRLDVDTTGLILITNDGPLANKIAHPRYQMRKTYSAMLDRPLEFADEETIKKGIYLPDGKVTVDAISCIQGRRPRSTVRITLHSGRFRIIKRLFATLGYTVEKLDRIEMAGITKKGLSQGKYRFLTTPEIRAVRERTSQI